LLLSLVLAPACGAPLATSGDPVADRLGELALRTDRTVYRAVAAGGDDPYHTFAFTLVAHLTNRTSAPVYLERCYPDTPYPIYTVVSTQEDVESAYAPVWACVGHDHSITVRPGETRTDSLRITGPNAWDGHTRQPFGVLAGRFRLSYTVGTCPAVTGCEVPGRVRESNEFEVRLGT
jgi:hypothetical protein